MSIAKLVTERATSNSFKRAMCDERNECHQLQQYKRRQKKQRLSTNTEDEDRLISDGEGASAKAVGKVEHAEGGSLANDLFSLHFSLHLLS